MSDQWPQGWYTQPDGRQRYWDGRGWSDPPASPMQPPAGQPFPQPQPPAADATRAEAVKKPASPVLGCVTLLILGLLLAAGAWFIFSGPGNSPAAPAAEQVKAMGTGPSQDTGKPISDAICNDLGANGLSLFQLKASTAKTSAMTGQEFAEYLYGNLAAGCPALLKDEGIRGFLTQWGVNPDA